MSPALETFSAQITQFLFLIQSYRTATGEPYPDPAGRFRLFGGINVPLRVEMGPRSRAKAVWSIKRSLSSLKIYANVIEMNVQICVGNYVANKKNIVCTLVTFFGLLASVIVYWYLKEPGLFMIISKSIVVTHEDTHVAPASV